MQNLRQLHLARDLPRRKHSESEIKPKRFLSQTLDGVVKRELRDGPQIAWLSFVTCLTLNYLFP